MKLQTQEYYCTLFNSAFLPMGVTMINSLLNVQPNACTFVLCLDEQTYQIVQKFFLKSVIPIKLSELENKFSELLTVKKNRTFGEYCWTLTPYTSLYILQNFNVNRVTYIDADLFFFKDPHSFISEMLQHQKHVLITEHAYDPKYDQTQTSGRFCVQFVTFQNSSQGLEVLNWWKERCFEWCYNRFEEGKFGDQMYLDIWPEKFKNSVHILEKKHLTLAPWNIKYYLKKSSEIPVFYHFHGFRFLTPRKVLLYNTYKIGSKAQFIYKNYLKLIAENLTYLGKVGFTFNELKDRNNIDLNRTFRNLIKEIIGIYKEKKIAALL